MYSEFERAVVSKVKAIGPPIYYEQREQFARSLPMLAVLSVALTVVLGGWLAAVLSIIRFVVSAPELAGALLLTPFFWLVLLPPILWAMSFRPLQKLRLSGWRLFVAGTVLSFLASLVSLNLIGILFSVAILYFTLQCYDEFSDRYYRY